MNVKWIRGLGATAAVAATCLAATQLAQARPADAPPAAAAVPGQSCALGANGSPIKHVIYLQFDNVHYRRDAPGVPSDLEQMPHLLHFLVDNGTLLTNDHTILISHTAGGILSSLTGLYPDRNGQTVTNSYGFFKPDGSVGFSSAFKYWTDLVDATPFTPANAPAPDPSVANDPLPNMITDGQKTTPAPWVPFTRAGCDVGGVGTANIELENTSTNATGDMTRVFGAGSPQSNEVDAAAALPSTPENAKAKGKPQADYVGIAVHCGTSTTSVCAANANARPDVLPDEPGGYVGYQALFGARYVDPAITDQQPCVPDTSGQPITDASGNCGFPGFDGMLARNTLGYVEQMQEHGVPVTYGYISDVHDQHTPNPATDSYVSTATGPGEAAHEAQLKAYDDAFQAFFQNLAAHGIDKSNTLFAITVDEGDHFTGGAGIPQSDGTLQYAHTACATLTACPSNQIGEVNANIGALLPAGEPAFSIHSDDAPTFYVSGHPAATDPAVRKLERDVAALRAPDPYVAHGQSVPLLVDMADPVEEQALHMINADPNRTPTFTLFGNDDFFFTTSNAKFGSPDQCGNVPLCAVPSFAWNHGDVQQEIGNTWAGLVGPGVAQRGLDARTWTDHTNLRPTILALTGLTDDYAHDGRVLVEALEPDAIPPALRSPLVRSLGRVYEQLDAPFGAFGQATLAASTRALAGGSATDDSQYARIEGAIERLTATRDALARQIAGDLDAAAFANRRVSPIRAIIENAQAHILIAAARSLARSTA